MKVCSSCIIEKPFTDFNTYKRSSDGYQCYCKSCKAIKLREYRKENPTTLENKTKKREYDKLYRANNKRKIAEYKKENKEKHSEQYKEYRLKNKDKIKLYKKAYSQKYYLKNKSDIKNKHKVYKETNRIKLNKSKNKNYQKRYYSDILFKLKVLLRHRTRVVLKHKQFKKNERFINYVGCTIKELSLYLESKFKDGMTWENHGKWHIDHIIPLATAKNSDDIYKLNHYTNLQPLWAEENLKKGSKI